MSFMDIVKSSFYGQYKAHSRALVTGVEGKNTRIKNNARDRESKRFDAFVSNRGLENEMEMTSHSVAPTENVDARKKQMLLWREERLRRKKMEPKNPPPFKAGVVTHPVAPFQEPIFKKNLISVTHTTNTVRRVTRAATRAQNEEMSHKASANNSIVIKPLAPIGAKFHAPKIIIKERKPTKCTPKLRYTGKMLGNLFCKNNSSASKGSGKKKKTKGGSLKLSGKTNNVRKSLPRKIFVEDMPCENSPNPKKTISSKSTTTTPTASNSSSTSDSNTELTVTSPFVTLGRGKGNRQRESVCKLKFGYGESPEKSASYLRTQLDEEVARLRVLCDVWKKYQEENDSKLTEESTDLINLAIGQTQLLMNKKLQQFRGLIAQCENKEKRAGEGMVTVEDLQGFWDMVYMQVVNVDVRFKRLDELKMKGWQEDDLPRPEVMKKIAGPKSKTTAKNPKSSIALKAMIQAARNKSKQNPEKPPPMDTLSVEPDSMVTFDGIFFSVVSPSKNTDASRMSCSPARSPMLRSVVTSEAKKRIASTTSNAMAVMRASSAARSDANQNLTTFTDDQISNSNTSMDIKKTPGKSILKTPGTNKKPPINRRSVKVIFYESGDDSSEETNKRTQSDAAESAEEKSLEVKIAVRGSKRTKVQPKDENSHPPQIHIHASKQKMKTRSGRRASSGIPLNENVVENDLDDSH